MNEQVSRYEPDEATIARDDALLDALGKGGDVPGDDTLAMALFMWREDLATAPSAAVRRAKAKRRKLTWGAIAVAIAATLGTGATVAVAANAEPDSPLWPITQRIFTEHASTASASAAKTHMSDARTAVTEQRLPEAQALLDKAEKLIANVTSLLEREALMAELQQVRTLLTTALGGAPLPSASPVPTPTPGAGGDPGLGTPTPSPSKTGLLPPLPTISVPPVLPSLPLP